MELFNHPCGQQRLGPAFGLSGLWLSVDGLLGQPSTARLSQDTGTWTGTWRCSTTLGLVICTNLTKVILVSSGIDMNDVATVIKARVFEGLAEFLVPYRLSLTPILEAAGIDPKALTVATTVLPLTAVARAFEIAAARTGDPCFGVKFALAYPPGGSGPIGHLVQYAPTLRDAMSSIATYMEGFIAPADVSYTENSDGDGILTWVMPLELTNTAIQFFSLSAAVMVWRMQSVAGDDWHPKEVALPHRPLPCAELYTSVFGRRVVFDSPVFRITIDRASLNRKSKSADPRLYDTLLLAGAADIIRVEVPADIVTRVRRKIHSTITLQVPDLDTIAVQLGLPPRALQWQLSQAGTSFERVLSDTRRMIAQSMLASSDLSMTQIAHAVGFSDSSSFTRACKAWFNNLSPSAYRAQARAQDMSNGTTNRTQRAAEEPADD
jgi:AraC-like DNA-binding protein